MTSWLRHPVSGYEQLDERKRLTAAKFSELLLVLEHPELPLHNNPAELAARTMVQGRNINYATQTTEGTKPGILSCPLLLLLGSWESAFLSMCVTVFLKLEESPLLRLFLARNLLLISSVGRGNQNNYLPLFIESIHNFYHRKKHILGRRHKLKDSKHLGLSVHSCFIATCARLTHRLVVY